MIKCLFWLFELSPLLFLNFANKSSLASHLNNSNILRISIFLKLFSKKIERRLFSCNRILVETFKLESGQFISQVINREFFSVATTSNSLTLRNHRKSGQMPKTVIWLGILTSKKEKRWKIFFIRCYFSLHLLVLPTKLVESSWITWPCEEPDNRFCLLSARLWKGGAGFCLEDESQ